MVDAFLVGRASVALGAGRDKKGDPVDFAAGLRVLRKPGERVSSGDPVLELHYNDPARLPGAVALVADALVVGITLLQQERRSMRGVDPDYIESLRQENRRLANLLEEYLLEKKAIRLNDQDLLERTVKELSHHRKRELGR